MNQIVKKVGVHACAAINANGAGITLTAIPCVFERFPGTFQKYPLLRVCDFSFSWGHAEKRSIEHFDIIETRSSRNELGVIQPLLLYAQGPQFFQGIKTDCFNFAADVLPEGVQASSFRKTSCHSDDGYSCIHR